MVEEKTTVAEYERRMGLWVTALRSGEFEQGHGALHAAGKHCCLGVACEVFRRETGTGEWRLPPGKKEDDTLEGTSASTPQTPLEFIYRYRVVPEYIDRSQFVTPGAVRRWFGLVTGNGQYFLPEEITSLSERNDSDELSFEEIADLIESKPEGLFMWTKFEEENDEREL